MTISSKVCTHCHGAGWLEEMEGVPESETECGWCEGKGSELVFGSYEERRLWNIITDLQQRVRILEAQK